MAEIHFTSHLRNLVPDGPTGATITPKELKAYLADRIPAGSSLSAGPSSMRCRRPVSGSSPRPGSGRPTQPATTTWSRWSNRRGALWSPPEPGAVIPGCFGTSAPTALARVAASGTLMRTAWSGEASPSPVYVAALLMRFGFTAHPGFKSPSLRRSRALSLDTPGRGPYSLRGRRLQGR